MTPSNPRHAAANPLLESLFRKTVRGVGRVYPPASGWLGFQLFATPIRGYYPVPDSDRVVLDRAQSIRLHTFLDDGQRCRLQTYVWGDRTRPAVLLLHGWMSSAAQMTNFVDPLLEAGFQVIALDGPAHGNSSRLQTNSRHFGQAIKAVIRQLGPLHSFIGHSFGAAASLLLLFEDQSVTLPQLTLIASPAETQFMMHVIARAIGANETIEANMQQRFLQRYGLPIDFFSMPKMAATLDIPGLVVHDRDDRLIPFEQGEAIAQAWPGAEFLGSEGLGHGDILRDAAIIANVVQFQGDPALSVACRG